MDWVYEKVSIDVGDRTGGRKYRKLYEDILDLRIGRNFGIQITEKSNREASNIRDSVHKMLKKQNLLDKYVVTAQSNKFAVWRVK